MFLEWLETSKYQETPECQGVSMHVFLEKGTCLRVFLGLCFNNRSPGCFNSSESWLTGGPTCFWLQETLVVYSGGSQAPGTIAWLPQTPNYLLTLALCFVNYFVNNASSLHKTAIFFHHFFFFSFLRFFVVGSAALPAHHYQPLCIRTAQQG